MLRKIFKIILGVAAGTALAHYFTSPRGRALLDRARDRLPAGGLDSSRFTGSGGVSRNDHTEDAIEAKIEETRRRLREQLEEIAQRPTEETDLSR
ncbi:MAG: hypothetical protein ACYCX3_04610 [Thermoleophilia bacterium]